MRKNPFARLGRTANGDRAARSKGRLRHSFTGKLFCSMVGCLLLMLFFCSLMNRTMLEQYYQSEKRRDLAALYGEIDTVFRDENGDWQRMIDGLNARANCSVVLLNERMRPVYISIGGIESSGWGTVNMSVSLDPELQNGQYAIEIENNERLQQKYLTLTGRLFNGLWCVIRSPLEAMAESVSICNRFLLFSGIGAAVLCGALAFLIARSFTRPIRQLADVTDSLAQLDFSKKYTGKSRDEIGALGERINFVSTELERNLSELKTANAQLQRDNEIKTRQDQLRRDFIANASHELKTPIALIRAYAEGVSEDVSGDPESRRYYCDIIQDEADKMNLLIKKMTSLMQLESGEEELTISRFEITELISGILRKYSILIDQKKVAVTFRPQRELYCWGDEYFIENVINNYMTNALNHVSAKGEIILSAEPVDAGEKKHVRVRVYNTGDPIAEEDLTRIWESFYKADKARTRAYGGTGLGLSVVAAIMRAHNMPCGVQNEPGGVCFWFELELA